jgi:hypothetical protein
MLKADGFSVKDLNMNAYMDVRALTQKFIDDWALIQQTIRTIKPDLEGFAKDSTILSTLLKEGKYVVHHSEKFNDHYQPHYRIIRKDVFEEKILPMLKK